MARRLELRWPAAWLGGDIVGAAEANPAQGRISNESPLGKALLNHKTGDRVQIDAPAGSFTVTIVKLE